MGNNATSESKPASFAEKEEIRVQSSTHKGSFQALLNVAAAHGQQWGPRSPNDHPDTCRTLLQRVFEAPTARRSRTVSVFVAAQDDFGCERDALVQHVWPFLASFCALLGLDLQIVDLSWNLTETQSLAVQHSSVHRALSLLEKSINDSHISIVLGLLGDRYGQTILPSSISREDFAAIKQRLESSSEMAPLVDQLLNVWYPLDENHSSKTLLPHTPGIKKNPSLSPSSNEFGIHTLRPVDTILPAMFPSDQKLTSTHSQSSTVQSPALQLWSEIRKELSKIIDAGAKIAFGDSVAESKGFGLSLAEIQFKIAIEKLASLSSGYLAAVTEEGSSETAKRIKRNHQVFCFQRTLLDLKRTLAETPTKLASTYVDLIPSSSTPPSAVAPPESATTTVNEVDKDKQASLTHLRQIHRATRFYAIPWRPSLGGLSPQNDNKHALYIASFCEDVVKVICEGILKQVVADKDDDGSGGAGSDSLVTFGSMDGIVGEVLRHVGQCLEMCDGFVGRENVLDVVEEQFFSSSVDAQDRNVLVIYGPSGIGKTGLMSKISHDLYKTQPDTVLLFRLIGLTPDSSDARSLLRSLCEQLVIMYGLDELKARVDLETSIRVETEGEMSVTDKLGDLEKWPPASYEGLKCGFEIALKMADELKPIVLILDAVDELTTDGALKTIDWLPKELPPYVKLIVSTASTSRGHSAFSTLSKLYPTSNPKNMYLEVPYLSESEVNQLVDTFMAKDNVRLQKPQAEYLLSKCNAQKLPLYIHCAWLLFARHWRSGDSVQDICKGMAAETVPGLVEEFFDGLERRLGRYFVGRAVGYITAARRGLGRRELEDLLSCDETAMNEVFQFEARNIRRIPPLFVERLLEELGGCLTFRFVDGVNALFWTHKLFHNVAEDRYLEQGQSGKIHAAFANYWEGQYTSGKQYYDINGVSHTENRHVMDQSLLIHGQPNVRRVSAIVWHQLAMGPSGFRRGTKTLQDISHLSTCIHGGLFWDLLASFRHAMGLEYAEKVVVDQLNEYYRFLVAHSEVLLADPNRLLPAAANLYSGSVVADVARTWILANAPGLNWVEWVNRPSARGEPIATLRPTDSGASNNAMTITGRDTYDERVILAGVRLSDNQAALVLFDISGADSAGSGGHVKVIGRCANSDVFEEGVPLVCVFSRKGAVVAVGGRSLVCVNGLDLSIVKTGRDSTLPDGDIITVIAWTANDGCIVTASDGSSPGRICLWDAGSLSLLKIVEAETSPQQPISASFSKLCFWDEGREMFVILDIDEFAMDPDSTHSLQYISNKAHSNPPPDSCARFAGSFGGNYVIVADESGKGYILIDLRGKLPVARLDADVDTVRYVSLSHDGKRVAIVPNDKKVIFVYGITQDCVTSSSKNGSPGMYYYQLLGTILGVDPTANDGNAVTCVFSRSGKTVLTDGDFGGVRVWNVNELGDHAIIEYLPTLTSGHQSVLPIRNSITTYLGWAVSEKLSTLSISDKKAENNLRSVNVSLDKKLRRSGNSRKDIIVSVSTHPSKPVVATVTNNGNLTLVYAEKAFHEKGWAGGFFKAAFGNSKTGDSVSFNVMQPLEFISPSSIALLDSAAAISNGVSTAPQSDLLSFAVGFENGRVKIYDWNTTEIIGHLAPSVEINLGIGRITSIVGSNVATCRTVALTLEYRTLLLWDGLTTEVNKVQVIFTPHDSSENHVTTRPRKLSNRRSVTSIMSITGLLDRNSDRPVAIGFSNTQEQLLATGEVDGQVTIWNTEAKVKRSLLIPSNDGAPAPVTAISWSNDDAALVSITEDKRVAVHNTVTGGIVWIHDLWMISPHLNAASFSPSARELVAVDFDGVLTCIRLHGDWPDASNADTFVSAKSNNIGGNSTSNRNYPNAPEPEFANFDVLDDKISSKLTHDRSLTCSRIAQNWEFSSGSSAHGHVALIKLTDGLPCGAYEVVCNVEVPPLEVSVPTVPLKFQCWAYGDVGFADPEMDIIHGFTRLVPVDEQKKLAGMGSVMLRLGFLKVACKLQTCSIDLLRLPGTGDPITVGDVHFLPVDSKLYRPDYAAPTDLSDAFDHLSVDFDEFEHAQGRRGSYAFSHGQDAHDHELINLLAENSKGGKSALIPSSPGVTKPRQRSLFGIFKSTEGGDVGGTLMWEAGEEEEDGDEIPETAAASSRFSAQDHPTVPDKSTIAAPSAIGSRKSVRMSVMQSIAGVKSNVTGMVGGILSSAAAALPTSAAVTSLMPASQGLQQTKKSPEDIQREMEEARRRGNEQARKFDEAEEFKALQSAKQREWMARQLEFEQDAKRKAALMQMQYASQFGEEYDEAYDDDDFGFDDSDLEGVDEDVKNEARRMMREMLQKQMEQDLGSVPQDDE